MARPPGWLVGEEYHGHNAQSLRRNGYGHGRGGFSIGRSFDYGFGFGIRFGSETCCRLSEGPVLDRGGHAMRQKLQIR